MSNVDDVEHYFVLGNEEIYWDGSTEEIVMAGSILQQGEERVSLREKLAEVDGARRAELIAAYFLYTVQEYVALKLGVTSQVQVLGTVVFDRDTGEIVETTGLMSDPGVSGTGSGSTSSSKKEELN